MAQKAAQTVSVVEAVLEHNAGRDPERLSIKLSKMTESPFVFLRGACHLFYDSLPDAPALHKAPLAWCCGDLHFENYGSYKGDDRQVYFDINDFDEAALAPATWDMVRLLTSIQCGADAIRATHAESLAASRSCLDAYRHAMLRGKPLWVERETSSGLVNDLLTSLRNRERAAFLDKRTERKSKLRHLKLDGVKALPVTEAQRSAVTAFMDQYAATQARPGFFKVIVVGRRIAGTGSLGVDRFVVLVEGKGSPDGNYLLDIKESKPSALAPHLARLGVVQPAWKREADRVVTIQKRMQSVDHAFLESVCFEGKSYILRGLQPSEDRVAISAWGKDIDKLNEVTATMGRILAWDQLRASGRDGAACADKLIGFAGQEWTEELLEIASEMTALTRAQWQGFLEGFKVQRKTAGVSV